jgi:hypothetical protein
MFVGHAGLALLARARRTGPSFWVLLAAAFGPDWLELPFRLARVPFGRVLLLTHSLLATVACAVVGAVAYGVARHDRTGALLVAAAWLSHWPADLLTGLKPTWPGGPSLGISLYAHPGLDLLVEVGIAIAAWAVYAQRHRPMRGVLLGVPTLLVALQVAFANQGRLGGSWKQELLQGVVARVRARLDSASG